MIGIFSPKKKEEKIDLSKEEFKEYKRKSRKGKKYLKTLSPSQRIKFLQKELDRDDKEIVLNPPKYKIPTVEGVNIKKVLKVLRSQESEFHPFHWYCFYRSGHNRQDLNKHSKYKDDKMKKRADKADIPVTTARDVWKTIRDLDDQPETFGISSYGTLPNIGMSLPKTQQKLQVFVDPNEPPFEINKNSINMLASPRTARSQKKSSKICRKMSKKFWPSEPITSYKEIEMSDDSCNSEECDKQVKSIIRGYFQAKNKDMRSFCDADFEEILHISKHHNPYTEIISNGAGEDVLIEDQYYNPFKSRNIASEFRKSKKTVTFDPHEAKRLQKTQQSFWNTRSNPNIHYSKPEKSRNRGSLSDNFY
ncbi:unnamed protein product [Moneuplotes crassus]|uniref:Uncharacterized protein n=1 Tax=Euplotes crassus TaxID=5936 RepID=A0AAD1U5L8_EUPCR|nr:unnamed protein product [Moneuplotes crassus]